MKIGDMKNKNMAELTQELHALLKEQFNLRMQRSLSEAPKTHLFRRVKRDIARIKTLLNSKKREDNNG
ncbi:MAG: 50S ribosomal protein L29 [Gammaproteobacteria bacterium]|nr:50S ribosomal protein L29 [Gammaproteobacteria bacterium]